METAVLAGLVALVLSATALASIARRVDRHVTATAASVERLRLLRLAATSLRTDATHVRSQVDSTVDTVRHLGRR